MRVVNIIEGAVVAVFGGSFDPVTHGHIQIATEVLNFGLADQVWMVPSGLRKDKVAVVMPIQRLEMLTIALDSALPDWVPIYVDNTEVANGETLPTQILMSLYREKYPSLRFKFILGEDLIPSLHRWFAFPQLIAENSFIVYRRAMANTADTFTGSSHVQLNDTEGTIIHVEKLTNSANYNSIFTSASSSEVRKRIIDKGDTSTIIGLTPWQVIQYIQSNGLYRQT